MVNLDGLRLQVLPPAGRAQNASRSQGSALTKINILPMLILYPCSRAVAEAIAAQERAVRDRAQQSRQTRPVVDRTAWPLARM